MKERKKEKKKFATACFKVLPRCDSGVQSQHSNPYFRMRHQLDGCVHFQSQKAQKVLKSYQCPTPPVPSPTVGTVSVYQARQSR